MVDMRLPPTTRQCSMVRSNAVRRWSLQQCILREKHPIPQMFACQQQSENFHQRFKTIEDTAREAMQSFRWHETKTLTPHVSLTTVHNGAHTFPVCPSSVYIHASQLVEDLMPLL